MPRVHVVCCEYAERRQNCQPRGPKKRPKQLEAGFAHAEFSTLEAVMVLSGEGTAGYLDSIHSTGKSVTLPLF